jgi:hypothetical protein
MGKNNNLFKSFFGWVKNLFSGRKGPEAIKIEEEEKTHAEIEGEPDVVADVDEPDWEGLGLKPMPEEVDIQHDYPEFIEPVESKPLHELGSLSEKYETGGRGPCTISGGKGDWGGKSYGSYQMASKVKGRHTWSSTVGKFIAGSRWHSEFKGHADYFMPGDENFDEVWLRICRRDRDGKEFAAQQHDFIRQTHYEPCMRRLEKKGFGFLNRHFAVYDVIWSVSVQHGAFNGAELIERAMRAQNLNFLTDRDIIKLIYTERSSERRNGELKYFSRCSAAVQEGVRRRFRNEEKDALKLLEG